MTYLLKLGSQCRLGTVSNRLREGLGYGGEGALNYVLLDPNPRPLLLQCFKTIDPPEGFLTHQ